MNELTQGPNSPQQGTAQSQISAPTVSVNPAAAPIGLPGIGAPQNSGASKKKLWIGLGAGAGALALVLIFFTQSSLFKGSVASIPNKCNSTSSVFTGERADEKEAALVRACAARNNAGTNVTAIETNIEPIQDSDSRYSDLQNKLSAAENELNSIDLIINNDFVDSGSGGGDGGGGGGQVRHLEVKATLTEEAAARVNAILDEVNAMILIETSTPPDLTACIALNINPPGTNGFAEAVKTSAITNKEAIYAVEVANPDVEGIKGKTDEANTQIALIDGAIQTINLSDGNPTTKCEMAKAAKDAGDAVATLLSQVQAKVAELSTPPPPDVTDAAIPSDLLNEIQAIRDSVMEKLAEANIDASAAKNLLQEGDSRIVDIDASLGTLTEIDSYITEKAENASTTDDTATLQTLKAGILAKQADFEQRLSGHNEYMNEIMASEAPLNAETLSINLGEARTGANEDLERAKAYRDVITDQSSNEWIKANDAVTVIEGAVENLVTAAGAVSNSGDVAANEEIRRVSVAAIRNAWPNALMAARDWTGGEINKADAKINGIYDELGIATGRFEIDPYPFDEESYAIKSAWDDVMGAQEATKSATEPDALKNLIQKAALAEKQAGTAYTSFKTKLAALGCNDMKVEVARAWASAEAEAAQTETENYQQQIDTLAAANDDFSEKAKQVKDRLAEIENNVSKAKEEAAEKSDVCTAAADAKKTADEAKTVYEKAKAKADEIASREQRAQNLEAQLTSLQQQLQTQISNNAAASQVSALERELQALRRQAEEERQLAASSAAATATASAAAAATATGSGSGGSSGSASSGASSGSSSGSGSGSSSSSGGASTSTGGASASSGSITTSITAPAAMKEVVVVVPDKTQSKTKQKNKTQTKTAAAGSKESAEAESAKAGKVKQKAAEIGAAVNAKETAAQAGSGAQKTPPASDVNASKTAGKQTGTGNVAAGQSQGSAQSSGGSAGAVSASKKPVAGATESKTAASGTNAKSEQKQLRGSYIQGQTGPGFLLYPILIGAGNGLYWIFRRRKSR